MLRELSGGLLEPTMTKSQIAKAICGDFANVGQGLYVFLFSNSSSLHVYDNNKKRNVVVHANGTSMKPGKFENGFAKRVANYHEHLHRERSDDRPVPILCECFLGGYWLDLSEANDFIQHPARIFERYWNEAIHLFLERHSLLAKQSVRQKRRAEWRYLDGREWNGAAEERLRAYLAAVANRVMEMARVGAYPAPIQGPLG